MINFREASELVGLMTSLDLILAKLGDVDTTDPVIAGHVLEAEKSLHRSRLYVAHCACAVGNPERPDQGGD